MSQGTYESEVRDSWEIGLSIPAISFADHRAGEGFENAILLPTPDGKFAGKGYREIPVMEPKTIKGPDNKPVENPNYGKPRRWRDGRIMQQNVLTVLTGLNTLDFNGFMSAQAIEKFKAATTGAEPGDMEFISIVGRFGLRRLFIQGGSLEPEFKTAVKAKGKAPAVGGLVSVKIAKMESNDYGGKTKFYAVRYDVPTPDSLAKVAEFLSVGSTIVNDYLQINMAPGAATDDALAQHAASEEEPPF